MKSRFQRLLQDRKTLYLVLGIVIISVFTLSVAYAALSTVLEISGNAHISSAEWDIYLSNPKVTSGSVSTNAPQISGTSTLGFDVELSTPGDFYEFTVDVVNGGSIDAMIDSVVKTPELTTEQAKYIKYEITYENGDSISTNQTLKKETSTSIKVRVEYRKDIVASDLPSTSTELSLKLTLVYVQSDGSGASNGSSSSVVRVVSGDGTQVGNEVCIKEECFYVISSDDTSITMLAKYNLYVGGYVEEGEWIPYRDAATGIQYNIMLGWVSGQSRRNGTTVFSDIDSMYSASIVQGYVNEYDSYLITQGVTPIEARLISFDELESLGCIYDYEDNMTCSDAPSWVYATSYWSGSSYDSDNVWTVSSTSYFAEEYFYSQYDYGVRPVITISKDYL